MHTRRRFLAAKPIAAITECIYEYLVPYPHPEHDVNMRERLPMHISINTAIEIGEALLDAAQNARENASKFAVVTLDGDTLAASMPFSKELDEYGYKQLYVVHN